MRKIILSLSVPLVALFAVASVFILSNCGGGPKKPSSTSGMSDINLVVNDDFCGFPPAGGFTCRIEIFYYNASTLSASPWKIHSKSDADFTGNTINVEIPASGQFQINVTIQAKACKGNCCSACIQSGMGKAIYTGNTGIVDSRGRYDIIIDQVACRCC